MKYLLLLSLVACVTGGNVTETAEAATAKPGSCPGASARTNLKWARRRCDRPACEWDTECSGPLKCCQQACGNRCRYVRPPCDSPCGEGNRCRWRRHCENELCRYVPVCVKIPVCKPPCSAEEKCLFGNRCFSKAQLKRLWKAVKLCIRSCPKGKRCDCFKKARQS